jgi:Helix-turn-helix domain
LFSAKFQSIDFNEVYVVPCLHRTNRINGLAALTSLHLAPAQNARYSRPMAGELKGKSADFYITYPAADTVRVAREAVGLTVAELAKRLEVDEALVLEAEAGGSLLSDRYVHKVLAACGLPESWVDRTARRKHVLEITRDLMRRHRALLAELAKR